MSHSNNNTPSAEAMTQAISTLINGVDNGMEQMSIREAQVFFNELATSYAMNYISATSGEVEPIASASEALDMLGVISRIAKNLNRAE